MNVDDKNTKSSVFAEVAQSSKNALNVKPVLIEKKATKTSHGILSKGWYKVGSATVLAKGDTKGSSEPFAEVIGGKNCLSNVRG